MYLYHGSNVEITKIDFEKCREKADFGRGFYTTNIKEQAVTWAKRKAVEHMDSEYNPDIKAVVTSFDFDASIFDDAEVEYRRFRGTSDAWLLFVRNNTQRNFQPIGEHNLEIKYDLVSGYIAVPEIFTLLEFYEKGVIDRAVFRANLKNINKTNQYSFHTLRSTKYLKSPIYEYFDVTKEEFDELHVDKNSSILTFHIFDKEKMLHKVKLIINLANPS